MTTATTASPSPRRARIGAAATGLAAALTLTACGGSGDGDAGPTGETGENSSSAPTPGVTETGGTDDGSGTAGPRGALEGSWVATTGGRAVALIVTGERAAVFESGGAVCSGTAEEQAGTGTIRLKCTDGSDARAQGTVGSVDAGSLTVTWEGGIGAETFQKAEGGTLPSGLPSGLLSGLPAAGLGS
ncbi:hypothetical protein [Streptomyces sp. CRN 30]|uniref:hypothetical protein n=1 Tax=Streptomyces sp. CRN 30 TaxID=3075613 RepID=UPI002A82C1C9|nr:hypothetical protein [Streptomyces sp. CRN 30]